MQIDKEVTPEKSELTKQVLTTIARHLSGRPDCKDLNYMVAIGTDNVPDCIMFEPARIRVLPNRYKRHESDKVSVLTHVIRDHFQDLYKGPDGLFNVKADTAKLVKGIYMYESSVDHKRRRWVRVE